LHLTADAVRDRGRKQPDAADSAVISHRPHSLLGALKHRFRDVHTDPLSSRK